MTTALITGGTGFIGSNIALRLLEYGWKVRILSRPGASHELLEGGPFEFVTGDVLEPETIEPALQHVDVVFHCAGVVDYWRQGKKHMYRINVDGTRNVMAAALQAGIDKVVHTSSSAALGIHPNRVVDETYTFNTGAEVFPYGYSKFLAEQVVFDYVNKGLPAVIVNPTTVIGPRDIRKVSNWMVVEIIKHCAPLLVPPGGQNIVPICDVSHGHVEAAVKGEKGERYLLGGHNLTLMEFYQAIADVMGCGMKLRAMPRWQVGLVAGLTDLLQPQTSSPMPLTGERLRLESKFFYYDDTKARTSFQMPTTSLHTTIGRTFMWYDLQGEFTGLTEKLDKNGKCKYCGHEIVCRWPPPK